MIYLAGGILLLVVVLVTGRAFVDADPTTVRRVATVGGALLAAALILLLIVAGQVLLLFLLLVGAAFAARPAREYWRRWIAGTPTRPDSVSEVETDYLRMTLEHDTGSITGVVRKGRYQGRRLEELDLAALLALRREVRLEDRPSLRLIESYLDRFEPDWRKRQHEAADEPPAAATAGRMTPEEALAVLGLKPGASAGEIKEAHRRLMMKLHPDQGGSTALATQVNLAKDVLLGE